MPIGASEPLQFYGVIDRVSTYWTLNGMDAEILQRSRRSFPREPNRPLGAIHLATALAIRNLSPEVQVLSIDDRIRDNASAFGFEVVPVAARQL